MPQAGLALWCESEMARIIAQQEDYGVNFDRQRAGFLLHQLAEKTVLLDHKLVPQLPMMLNKADTYKKPFLKSGKVAKWPRLYCQAHGIPEDWIGGPFTRVWYTPFDPSKTAKIKMILIEAGWKPDEWNEKKLEEAKDPEVWIQNYITNNFIDGSANWKAVLLKALNYKGARTRYALAEFLRRKKKIPTSPKITEDSLKTVSGTVGLLVKDRVVLSHRRSLVQGIIKRLRPDGRTYQGANPDATPTHRMKHRVIVNIPAPRSPYGAVLRSLFMGDKDDTCPARIIKFNDEKGRLVRNYIPAGQQDHVGVDAAGLEARMLCHYMDDPAYTDLLLNGDIHTYNQELAGLPTRDDAKTFIYALMYGAGDGKLGEIVGGGQAAGAEIRARFMRGLPKYKQLVERLTLEAESGIIRGLDGRALLMRKGWDGKPQTHKALNTLLQSAGAIVMKYSGIFLDQWVRERGLNAHQLTHTHDEFQYTCHPSDTEELVYLMSNCVRVAGEFLNMNIPLASDPIVGRDWQDTH